MFYALSVLFPGLLLYCLGIYMIYSHGPPDFWFSVIVLGASFIGIAVVGLMGTYFLCLGDKRTRGYLGTFIELIVFAFSTLIVMATIKYLSGPLGAVLSLFLAFVLIAFGVGSFVIELKYINKVLGR